MDALAGRHLVAWEGPLMGGSGAVELTLPASAEAADLVEGLRLGRSVARRLAAWADRLSRFRPASDLSRLNAGPAVGRARPILAAVLGWAIDAPEETDGIVVGERRGERLAAEDPAPAGDGGRPATEDAGAAPRWRLRATARGGMVTRAAGVRLDIDGVAKGWLADRALRLLVAAPGARVDADGDIAVRVAPGDAWEIAVAAPAGAGDLATLRLTAAGSPRPASPSPAGRPAGTTPAPRGGAGRPRRTSSRPRSWPAAPGAPRPWPRPW